MYVYFLYVYVCMCIHIHIYTCMDARRSVCIVCIGNVHKMYICFVHKDGVSCVRLGICKYIKKK